MTAIYMRRKLSMHDGRNRLSAILDTVSRREVFIVCHGLAGRADDQEEKITSEELERMGYSTFRVSHRTGKRNELLFEEQVRQINESVSVLRNRYDFRVVHLLGISMGASNAVIAGSMDSRVASICAVSGISDGETWMRERHGRRYNRFMAMLNGMEEEEYRTGTPHDISVNDLLEPNRKFRQLIEDAARHDCTRPSALSARSVRSLMLHSAVKHVGSIAGRPLVIAHGESDSLVSAENSRRLHAAASEPKKLMLYGGIDHDLMIHEAARKSVLSAHIDFLSEHS